MERLDKVLARYGKEKRLAPGEVLVRQGSASDGVYYLREGLLGVYREEEGDLFALSEIRPGELVGELGATTGRSRIATVKAEEACWIVHIPDAAFQQALDSDPGLAAEIVRLTGERLTAADTARITLRQSYQQSVARVQALHTEKDRLEELLRLREELADTIVHDLRNPLGVLSAGFPLLKRCIAGDIPGEHAAAMLEPMERSVLRMQQLVDTLLDMAHLEEAQARLQLLPVDIVALVAQVMAEEQPLAKASGVLLENRLPAALPKVLADQDLLLRVLVNLLDNGLKYTPDGGQIWIEAKEENGSLQMAVVDTGPGIPIDDRERIFEKFTQVKGRVGARRGSGLGLAFCKMAIEAHGGRIWVESGPQGAGSRFAFTLSKAK